MTGDRQNEQRSSAPWWVWAVLIVSLIVGARECERAKDDDTCYRGTAGGGDVIEYECP